MRLTNSPRAGGSVAERLLGAAAVIGIALLVVDLAPSRDLPRSLVHAWDLGHIAVFFLAARWLIVRRVDALPWPPARKVGLVLALCLGAGAGSELLQSLSADRTASLFDVGSDLSGGALALGASSRSLRASGRRWRAGLFVAGFAWFACALWPVGESLIDETRARQEFPLLSGLEHWSERTRWHGSGARLSLSDEHPRSGRRSLRVDLTTAPYAAATLESFPPDWRGRKTLRLSMYRNPGELPEEITLRVHDSQHSANGMRYADRFNRVIELQDGWNEVVVPLRDIETAPRGRNLDLSAIRNVSVFATALPAPAVLWIDDVRLE